MITLILLIKLMTAAIGLLLCGFLVAISCVMVLFLAISIPIYFIVAKQDGLNIREAIKQAYEM